MKKTALSQRGAGSAARVGVDAKGQEKGNGDSDDPGTFRDLLLGLGPEFRLQDGAEEEAAPEARQTETPCKREPREAYANRLGQTHSVHSGPGAFVSLHP